MAGRRGTVLVLLALLVAGCGRAVEPDTRVAPPLLPRTPAPTSSPAPTPSPTPTPLPPSPTPDAAVPSPTGPPETGPGPRTAVPLYYVTETPAGARLQREFHRVVADDPASGALRVLLATSTGSDPDYRNVWPDGTRLRGPVVHDRGAIVVDLAGVAPGQLDAATAQLAVQQVVFTVQGALQSTDPVRILLDGARVEELGGGVRVGEPVQRGDAYALRSLVQIDTPAHGARVGRQVRVSGEAAVFEATVRWEVLRDGTVVQSGFTSTTEGQRFSPFAFEVALEPGQYTVRVLEDDPSGGEGGPVLTDDKAITVVG